MAKRAQAFIVFGECKNPGKQWRKYFELVRYAYCAPKVDYASVRSTVGVAFAAKASEMSARILRMVAFLWGEAGVMGE